jgi:hypothetical protein
MKRRDYLDRRERFVVAMLLLGYGPRIALAELWDAADRHHRRAHG